MILYTIIQLKMVTLQEPKILTITRLKAEMDKIIPLIKRQYQFK